MADIQTRLADVRQRIRIAEKAADRPAQCVRLLAVSKTFDAQAIRLAHAAGQHEFGENYLQEALTKREQLADLPLVWHFIGPLQSNKTRAVAEAFDWVHGVDREKIAVRLAEQRPAGLPPLQICVQVNISGEASKSGCAPADTAALCAAVARLPRLRLRGLMAIPEPGAGDPRAPFHALHALYESLQRQGHALDTLSAGMSDDLEAAIAEGSTLVRVGSAIFGSRPRKPVQAP
ncbi:YggS family pyridoxal phosphate-dependent enzyme [Solimonas terrae]|uniref:Pyridoxal phosphate homeostasis protein n=1 Tax=Solimonas terrae TaxID=1396819 RepID=A0A6M2BS63_9GAMM|nr:YggS family pyridoxal phosphate-dependent enzyme [Solimonas terrae]NGY05446.1 YggS family pyridoxal phosphate-dependent enzyme [Solimonas terrae]